MLSLHHWPENLITIGVSDDDGRSHQNTHRVTNQIIHLLLKAVRGTHVVCIHPSKELPNRHRDGLIQRINEPHLRSADYSYPAVGSFEYSKEFQRLVG